VRQLLYGQRYVLEKFGNVSTVAWPDSFGFCATLPDSQAGNLVTTKTDGMTPPSFPMVLLVAIARWL